MAALGTCLLKHPLSQYQAKRVKALAAEYRDAGNAEPEARAAEDLLNELLDERTDIIRQVVAAGGQDPAVAANEEREEAAEAEALELSVQTEESRRAEEAAAEQRRKDEAEREAADKAKARADKDRAAFTLTGSDRPADVAMAGGQQDLLAAPSKPAEIVGPETIPGTRDVAQRAENARERFVTAVNVQFGIDRETAQRAAAELIKVKLLKLDPVTGQFSLANGDAWNADVIRRAATSGVRTESPKSRTKPHEAGTTKPESGTAAKTEDAGQELWFNRRNSAGKGLSWDDIKNLNDSLKVKEATKSKVWPRPDYEQLVADGMPALTAHIVKQVYDSISTKPDVRGTPTDAQVREYVETVQRVRDATFAWARDASATGGWAQKILDAAKERSRRVGGAMSLSMMVPAPPVQAILNAVFPLADSVDARYRFRVEGGDMAKDNLARARLIGGNKPLAALKPDFDAAMAATKAMTAGWPAPQEAWQRRFDIQKSNDDKSWEVVGKAGRGWRKRYAQGLESEAAAIAKAKELASRDSKERYEEENLPLAKLRREGAARRAPDEDITSERLMEAFGFRGVNFGNWMKGDANASERQAHLNHAYDAFADLADLMGLPPKAMSLNGLLGIAFGAQGRGGSSGAAHFVPGVNEINLTRASGAGAIAHEWAHAMDHYFAVQAGGAKLSDPFLTAIAQLAPNAAIRPEILAAFRSIGDAMNRRQETAEEADSRIKSGAMKDAGALQRMLTNVREQLEKAAAPAQKERALAEFDELAERMKRGDVGEGRVVIGQNTSIRQVTAQVRSLYKDAVGKVPSKDLMQWLDNAAGRVAFQLGQKEATKTHEPQKVASSYAKDAAALDADKGGKPYWNTPWEKFARAFQSYAMDKLAERSARNDYLTRPQSSAEAFAKLKEAGMVAGDWYPRAGERSAINAAFDALVGTLKTRETEQGTALYTATSARAAFARYDRLGQAPATAAQALADAEALTGLHLGVPVVEKHLADMPQTPAYFDMAERQVVFNTAVLTTRARAAEYLAEELLHAVDALGPKRTLSAGSKRLDRGGDIAKESQAQVDGDAELANFLAYPLKEHGLTRSEVKAELFARLGVLYFGDPDLMRRVLPTAYEAFHGIFRFEETSPQGDGRVLRQVWGSAVARPAQDDRQRGSVGRRRGEDARGHRHGHADQGLGQSRTLIARALDAPVAGARVQFSRSPSTLYAMGGPPGYQALLPGVPPAVIGEADATSIKNAETARQRAQRGIPEAEQAAAREFGAVWEEAKPTTTAEWRAVEDLVAELSQRPRPLTDTENAKLLYRQIQLQNELDGVVDQIVRLHETGTQADMVPLELRQKRLEEDLLALYDIEKAVGTANARGLNARRIMAQHDYSLARMKAAVRAQVKGRELTPDEAQAVEALNRRIRELEQQLEEREAERRSIETFEQLTLPEVESGQDTSPVVKKRRARDLGRDLRDAIAAGEKPEEYGSLIQRIARSLVEQGVRERNALIDGVHQVLTRAGATITRREVMDAISGYGKFTPLSREAVDVELRRMKGEMQQVSKLEDMLAGRAPLKTGMERREPSGEERDLIRQVNEMKKRLGIQATDPAKQLKSALDAIKTRLRHQISDYERAMANLQRIDRSRTPSPSDAEVQLLRAARDAARDEYERIFPAEPRKLTDAERAAIAERGLESAISDLERRIKDGDIGHALRPTPVTSTKLDALRARREALQVELEALREANPAYQEQQALWALSASIADYERRIEAGELVSPTKDRVKTPATEALEAKRKALRMQLEVMRQAAGIRDQQRLEAALAAVRESIAEYTRKIAAGDVSGQAKPSGPTSPELEALRAERDALAKVHRAMQRAATPKRSPEEIALQSLKTRLRNETARLNEKIAARDFAPPVKRAVTLDQDAHQLRFDRDKAKREFHELLMQHRIANLDSSQKFWHGFKEFMGLPRALQTMLDFSAVLRQGSFIVLGHPLRGAKALPSMWKAAFSEAQAHKAHEEILARPNATSGLYQRAGLYIAGENGKLSHKEEVYMNRWVEKIPVLKHVYKGSERAYVTFLNRLRADSFDALASTLAISRDLTAKEASGLAYFINNATGRGSVFGQQAGGELASTIFYSPRYLTSRFAMASMLPILKGGSVRTSKAIGVEYLRYAIGLSLVYALAAMGADDEDERERMLKHSALSPDFGKIVVGNTRIDPLSGFAQVITFTSRIVSGHTETVGGKVLDTRGEGSTYGRGGDSVFSRFLQTKLAPTTGLLFGLLVTGNDFKGDPLLTDEHAEDAKKIAFNAATPLSVQSIVEIAKDRAVPETVALSALAMLGVGIQVYDE